MSALHQATGVSIGGRCVLIEGEPGTGKSSLALALIDRGAVLVGDDGVSLEARDGRLFASPAPATTGLIEVRNVGLIEMPVALSVPVCLVLRLDAGAPRFVESAEVWHRDGQTLPLIRLYPDTPVIALRAELAMSRYGLAA